MTSIFFNTIAKRDNKSPEQIVLSISQTLKLINANNNDTNASTVEKKTNHELSLTKQISAMKLLLYGDGKTIIEIDEEKAISLAKYSMQVSIQFISLTVLTICTLI